MTPAERALLLAVAKTLRDTVHPRIWTRELDASIAAVEAEAAFAAEDEAELAEVAAKARAIEAAPIPPASVLDNWQPSYNRRGEVAEKPKPCETGNDISRVYEEAKAMMRAAADNPEPLTEGKSCETCRFNADEDCAAPLDEMCLPPTMEMWQPKPTEAVCPTCEGKGRLEYLHYHHRCPDCGGTGKEKK